MVIFSHSIMIVDADDRLVISIPLLLPTDDVSLPYFMSFLIFCPVMLTKCKRRSMTMKVGCAASVILL